MTRKSNRTLFITTLICFLTFTGYYAFLNLSQYKDIQKSNIPFYFYILAIILNVILNVGLNANICKKNGAKKLVSLGKWTVPVTMMYCSLLSIYTILFPNSSVYDSGLFIFIGLIFIISGNYFPKNHVNPYIGLKFPWLFNDEESWDRTHKLASYTWILAGFLLILQVFFNSLKIVSIPLVIILVGILPLVYSLMLVYKKKS